MDNTTLAEYQNFGVLVDNVYQTHCALQQNAQRTVNVNLTVRNWLIGCYIVEFEQKGEDRAKYGEKLLEELAKRIKAKGVKGLDLRTLRSCRKFYNAYPQIRQTVFAKFERIVLQQALFYGKPVFQIRGAVSRKLESPANFPDTIRGSVSPELEKEYPIAAEMLLSRLNFSHFIELLRRDDPLERLFYEVETIKNNWSVRQLERAIDTGLAFRTAMSKNKEAIVAKLNNLKPATNAEIIRNPIVLEFLDLPEKPEFTEPDLEKQILDHLQEFLLELGGGFCFEARQKRITFNNKHYRIDLVFYHKILKCNVLIDLKIRQYDYPDAGQMNLYLNYWRENEMCEGDNLPVGILLCDSKDDVLVRYSTAGMDDRMFVSKYLLTLPDKKILEDFIKRETGIL
jgi:predicted nuclease of restriction endonuclease-like (RecB) superfamily